MILIWIKFRLDTFFPKPVEITYRKPKGEDRNNQTSNNPTKKNNIGKWSLNVSTFLSPGTVRSFSLVFFMESSRYCRFVVFLSIITHRRIWLPKSISFFPFTNFPWAKLPLFAPWLLHDTCIVPLNKNIAYWTL